MIPRWLIVHALLLSACTTEHMVGSTCEQGVCATAVARPGIPCVFSTGAPGGSADDCLTERVHKSATDMAPCRAFFSLADPAVTCDSLGFATATDVSLPSATLCEIPQLEESQRAATPRFATGWFIEGPPLPDGDACSDGTGQRFRLNGPPAVPAATRLSCGSAIAAPEDVSPALRMGEQALLVQPSSCAGLPPLPMRVPEDTGAVCVSRAIPPEGFFTDRTYIDVGSEQCTSGVCLVDATQSPSPWPCEAGTTGCSSDLPGLEDYTYCSCRCDAKGDDSRAPCECPMGFTCVNQLLASDVVPDAVAGSYCVREFFL
jgi:hypothetical protein